MSIFNLIFTTTKIHFFPKKQPLASIFISFSSPKIQTKAPDCSGALLCWSTIKRSVTLRVFSRPAFEEWPQPMPHSAGVMAGAASAAACTAMLRWLALARMVSRLLSSLAKASGLASTLPMT